MAQSSKRTLLEGFLHKEPASQSQDEFEQWVNAPAVAAVAQKL
jgi:hypothetical protein